MPQIESEYIKTGKIKLVFLDFPLESIHKKAFKASEAAHCAGDQGKYWEMHDLLFKTQNALDMKDFVKHAETLGLDLPAFNECLEKEKHAGRIRATMKDALAAGVGSVPVFLLGFPESEGKVKAVKMIKGAQPFASFKGTIDELLKTQK